VARGLTVAEHAPDSPAHDEFRKLAKAVDKLLSASRRRCRAGSRVANIAAIAGASAGLPHPGRAANQQATMPEARAIRRRSAAPRAARW